jgi:hypothetical protein
MTAAERVIPWSAVRAEPVNFEMPKSRTLMHGEPSARWVRNRLEGLGDCFARLEHVVGDLLDGEGTAVSQERAEILPAQKLHHHVRRARLEAPYVRHSRHVLALDAHSSASFALETRDRFAVLARLGQQELQSDEFVEHQVMRGHDDTHPAAAEDSFDAELSG